MCVAMYVLSNGLRLVARSEMVFDKLQAWHYSIGS